ncbi:RNA polymerase sigma-70 factor [Tengunoibacter tsumagoiensis]|uniref:DNA-directed RNA polymerase sigma-70 factor n=1 Tax=Tengunoibacter tsumagoiensis TaxID=2014871 RepID=A0A401ZUX0_9CHLR|nr:RNA polymerase sigma-70 factor [Tengunoibacter tsumagoiensis]GCE10709.1 DNA-directed RNA polymerase sigma-70 factor [Tengunoibacter tsumagoiensis]
MEVFETYRPLLFSIAYRMTGSASEAEDIVQETYLRSQDTPPHEIRSLKSFLTTIATRLCLNYLNSAHVEREQYIGIWLPEPVLTVDGVVHPQEQIEQKESLSYAFLVLLETLTAPERAIFLLHEVFDFPFQEISEIVDRTPAACRQIFHRAKERLAARQQRFPTSAGKQREMLESFLHACQSGNLSALTELLASDATAWADGGGKVRTVTRPISGREAVARFFLGLQRLLPVGLTICIEEVNGSASLVGWNGEYLEWVLQLDIQDDQIQNLQTVLNPDKLAFIHQQLQPTSQIENALDMADK